MIKQFSRFSQEHKAQSQQWPPRSGDSPRKQKRKQTAWQLFFVLWGTQGILLVEFVEDQIMIFGEWDYFENALKPLSEEIPSQATTESFYTITVL